MLKLFDDEEGPDLDVEIKTTNDYATHYNLWRQKEELNKLKTKYGDPLIANDGISEDESSSSDDEDEDGRELTAEFEKDFFKTLSSLKNKDPKIYDDTTVFFKEKQSDENEGGEKKRKVKKIEPMFMKDYERKMLLEKGAKFEESDEEEEQENDPRACSPTYVEEQRKLKESLKQALNDDGNEEENWGGLFMKRQKTKEEEEKEEEDYKKWLKGNKDQLENKDEESALKPLKEYWSNPGLDDTETFLRDYLLNKRYLDKEDANHIPTYEEIIHDSDDGFSEDEKNIDTQEEFEQKYNFRYEEPDQEFIKRYPRTMEHSVRKTDDRRKVKRQEIKERKEEEKKQKQEDLKQLKILKRREIGEQIKKLKEITGNNDLAFEDADLDGDFDPEAHDKRMQELFNDNYYGGEEGDLKPEFSDLEEELGPWKGDNETNCEDDNFVMDCDYDPNAVPKEKDKKGKRKRNRPGKKPKGEEEELAIDENDERYEEYMDELYKLDYEDMIGDTPCRFKYRDVMPNDFGLTVEEILLAKDRELNRWCSLKKTTQYRPDHMEKYDVIAYQRKSNNEDLKKKILPSLYSEDLEENLKELEKKQQIKPGSSENTYDEIVENFEQEENDKEFENINENTKQNKKLNIKQNDAIAENKAKEDTLNNTTESIGDGSKKENKSKKKKNVNNKQNKEIVENSGTSEAVNWTIETIESEEPKENKSKKKKNKKKLNKESAEGSVQNETHENVLNENTPKKRTHSESEQVTIETKNNENISEGIQPNGTNSKLTRRQRKNLRKKQMPSETANTTVPKTEVKESKNRKRKRSEQGAVENEPNVPKKKQKVKKDKKKKTNKTGTKDNVAISNSRLEAYGINPKKFKNKLKYKNKTSNK